MTERLKQPHGSDQRTSRRWMPWPRAGGLRDARTIPVPTVGNGAPESEPTVLGFPAEYAEADDGAELFLDEDDASPSDFELLVHRRPDRFGAAALVLAGVAANVSLSLSWSPGEGPSGLSLVQRGVEGVRAGGGASVLDGLWQPFVVVLSGGLLVLLGLLLLVPARAHRFIGVLALFVSLAAAAAVAVLVAGSGWEPDRFGPGMWCAVAVPALGVLGSLKAMLTVPLVTLDSR